MLSVLVTIQRPSLCGVFRDCETDSFPQMQYIFTHLGAAERWLDKAKNIPPPSTVSLGPDPSELLSGLRRTRVDALWRADKAIKKSVKKMRKLLGGLREDEIISNEDHDNVSHESLL